MLFRSALGGKVDLVAKVGNDPFGHQLIRVMKNFGVGTKWMLKDEKYFTTMAFVSLMQNGERDFVFNRGADGQLTDEDIAEINVKDYSIVHFGSATGFLKGPLQIAYKSLLQKANENNLFVSFDPNYRHLLFPNSPVDTQNFINQSWYFLQNCNFFKLSDEEVLLITQTSELEEAIKILKEKTTATFAITIGKEGTIFGYKGHTYKIPSISITPTDTTGAGDAFVGAVLFQLHTKSLTDIKALSVSNWENIILNANKAGARTCEYIGAMEAFKRLNANIFN